MFTYAAVDQDNVADDKYTDTAIAWSLNRFTVEPAFCIPTVTYEITSIVYSDATSYLAKFQSSFDVAFDSDADAPNDGTASLTATTLDYTSGDVPPGTYTFTVESTSKNGSKLSKTFTWTLIDPCGPPTNVQIDPLNVFSIPDFSIGVKHTDKYPTVLVEPNYCTFTLDITSVPYDDFAVQTFDVPDVGKFF